MKLYNYYRSSASYRVRIALNWKGVAFEYIPVHLLKGEQRTAEYRKINPMGHVPALDDEGFLVAESMAIVQYLDDRFPQRRLFPDAARERAQIIQLCELVNSGIQPLQNAKVQKYLEQNLGVQKSESDEFVRHWIDDGLTNLEKLLQKTAGSFCFGGSVTAADCFVVPQVFAARRFGVEVERFPNLARVYGNATALAEFEKAHPGEAA